MQPNRSVGDNDAFIALIQAAREDVFEALLDPATFEQAIDGCERIETNGPNAYTAHVRVRTMGINALLKVIGELSDLIPPAQCQLSLKADSQFGSAASTIVIRLEPDGNGSLLHYTAQTEVTGLLASVGSRLIEVTIKRLLTDLFTKLDARLAGSFREETV